MTETEQKTQINILSLLLSFKKKKNHMTCLEISIMSGCLNVRVNI
jgi:hypothetical protein